MAWTDDFVGLPHVARGRSRDGCDCFGLIMLLHKSRFGRDLPDHGWTRQIAVAEGAAEELRPLFERIETPQEGDLVLFNIGAHPIHVGYCVSPSLMLHSAEKVGSVLERWDRPPWSARLEGLYRYVG